MLPLREKGVCDLVSSLAADSVFTFGIICSVLLVDIYSCVDFHLLVKD